MFYIFLYSYTFYIFVILMYCDVDGFGMNLMKVDSEDRSQVACTVGLLRKYFHSGETLSGSLLSVSMSSASLAVQQNLMRAIHLSDESWTITVRNGHQEPSSNEAYNITETNNVIYEKPQCYFIVIENLENDDLESIFDDWKLTINWNPLAQFVVFLASVEESDEEMTELMIEILVSFLNKKVFNVNVIGQNEENGYFYGKTVFPYHSDNNCGNRVITIETLDICDYQDRDEDNEADDDNYDENEESVDNSEETEENDSGNINNESSEHMEEYRKINKRDIHISNEPQAELNYEFRYLTTDRLRKPIGESNDIDGVLAEEKSAEYRDNKEQFEENTTDENNLFKYLNKNLTEEQNEKYRDIKEKSEESPTDEKNIKFEDPKKDSTTNETNSKSDDANKDLTEEKSEEDRDNKEKSEESTTDENNSKSDDSSKEKSGEFEEKPEESIPAETNDKREEVKVYMEELYRALFMDKFPQDLSGCSLIAAFRPWEPYIFNEVLKSTNVKNVFSDIPESDSEMNNVDVNVFDIAYNTYDLESDDGGNSSEISQNKVKLSGIEYMMVQTIGERLHINIEMRIENKNLYHLFQLLMDGDIEMIIGGIDEDPSISQYVSSTIPYHQDDLTWCVAKAKRHHSLFNFLQSFATGTWTLTIAFIFVTTLQILLIQRILNVKSWSMRSFTATSLRVMGIILSQSIQMRSTTLALKITFFTAFFMGLMFNNVYQSFLVSTLTTPQSLNQIKRLMDLYEHRMSVMGSVDNVRHINKEDKIFKYIRENFQMCYNIEECLQRAAQNEHIAVAVSRQHSYYNPRIPRDHLYCFDRNENLYVYLVTMLLPKKYHLLHKINPIIQHIIESGHMQKWARDLDIKRKIRDEIKRVREDAFRSLTLVQVAGGFAFSGILLLFATGVFILEVYTYWTYIIKKKRIKFLRILHTKFQRI